MSVMEPKPVNLASDQKKKKNTEKNADSYVLVKNCLVC